MQNGRMMFANGTSIRKDSAPGKPALVQILQNAPTASHWGLALWVRGAPARQRACEQIPAGDDAPGRRILRDLLFRNISSPAGRGGECPTREPSEGEPTPIGRLCEAQALVPA